MIFNIRKILSKVKNKLLGKKPKEKVDLDAFIGENCIITESHFGQFNKINNNSYLHRVTYGDFTYSAQNVTFLNCNNVKFCSIA